MGAGHALLTLMSRPMRCALAATVHTCQWTCSAPRTIQIAAARKHPLVGQLLALDPGPPA